jgi:hypothetical protein
MGIRKITKLLLPWPKTPLEVGLWQVAGGVSFDRAQWALAARLDRTAIPPIRLRTGPTARLIWEPKICLESS